MLKQKELTKEDAAELDRLNTAVDAAIEARSNWLASKVAEYSPVAVGETLYYQRMNLHMPVLHGGPDGTIRGSGEIDRREDVRAHVTSAQEEKPCGLDLAGRCHDRR